MSIQLWPLVVLMLAPSSSVAGDVKLPCEGSKDEAQMRTCLTTELKNAESDLQRYTDECKRVLSVRSDVIASLEHANAAWRSFRDADCEAVSKHNLPGSAYPEFQDMGCKLVQT